MVLDTLCTILLSCKSSQISTMLLYHGMNQVDQDLAGMILSYQTKLLVTRTLILFVAGATPSPQGILYRVTTVHSMLEASDSRQQISKYSMKQPHKELYPELLTLCFSLLLFVCLWRYDFNVTRQHSITCQDKQSCSLLLSDITEIEKPHWNNEKDGFFC